MKTISLLLSLLLTLFLVNKTNAQWVQTNGPLGGHVYCVERVGNEIWAGTNIGVYTSDNEGLTWQKSSLINGICVDISSKNDTVLILYNVYEPDSFYNYVFYSIVSFNGGNTWSSPIYAFTPFGGFWPRLQRVQNTFLFTDSYSYWITHDFGTNWSTIDPSIQNGFGFLRIIGNNIVAESSTSSPDTYYYHISNDQGYSWQLIYTSTYPVMAYMTDSVFIFGDEINTNPWHEKVMRSINNGISWDSVFVTPIGISMGGILNSNDSIFIITNKLDTNYFSIDNGLTWNYINSRPIINYLNGDTLNVSNGDYIETSYNDGIVRHVNSQDSIIITNTGLGLIYINVFKSFQGRLYASEGINQYNSLYYSDNEGQIWNKFNFLSQNGYSIKDICFDGDTILVATTYSLLRSFDKGLTWSNVNNPNNNSSYWQSFPYINKLHHRIFYSCDSLYYSDNLGVTWLQLPIIPPPISGPCTNQYLNTIGRIFTSNTDVLALIDNNYLYRFDSVSNTWLLLRCQLESNDFQIVDSFFVGKTWDDSLTLSTDYGNTWQNYIINGLPIDINWGTHLFPTSIISINGNWFGVVQYNNINYGIYLSSDQGRNWQPISDNNLFKTKSITSLNGILYAGAWYNSVWRRSGEFYTITGTVYQDSNQNGIQDSGELGMPNIIVKMVTAGTVATTDTTGHYAILTDVIGDTLKPVLPVSFASSSPNSYLINGAASNKDFGIYITPGIADLSIDLTNPTPFVPGFYTSLQLSIINKGSLTQFPNIQLILDTSLTYISSPIIPNSIVGNTIQWNTSLLDYMDVQNIDVTITTSTTSTLGDSIQCFSSVNPIINDINTIDNYSIINELIIGSYDPNDKKCIQGNYFTPEQAQSGEELEYIIRFQNTGTYQATNIHVSDTLNSYLDYGTFRVISSSHPVNWNINGNAVVDFNFNNIYLPPSSQDELSSHGFVKYAIKCKQGVSLGNVITNTANIYFDFNPPIYTNTTTTAIAYSTLLQINQDFKNENPSFSILVYPNPTSENLSINISGYNKNDLSLFIYSNSGEIIKYTTISNNLNSIDINRLSNGIYYGMILNSQNKKIANFKFVFKTN